MRLPLNWRKWVHLGPQYVALTETLKGQGYFKGEPHLLAVVQDITERRQAAEEKEKLEAQLRHAQEMGAIGQVAVKGLLDIVASGQVTR